MFKNKKIGFKLVSTISVAFLIGISVIIYFLSANAQNEMRSNAIKSAINSVGKFKTLRAYYAKNIVGTVKQNPDMNIGINHKDNPNMIPLPATMIYDLSALFNQKENAERLFLYSDYPFPNRKDRRLDPFQKEAVDFLRKNKDSTFVKEEIIDGKYFMRVAIPDLMVAQGCVNCHNNHPETPKNDWAIGDMRGILEIQSPIDEQIASNHESLVADIWLSIFVFALILIILVLTSRGISNSIKKAENNIEQIADDISNFRLDSRVDTEDLTVDFRGIGGYVNNLIESFISPVKVTAHNIEQISNGIIPEKITEDYQGEFLLIKDSINNLIDNLNDLTAEVSGLVSSASAGELEKRADVGNLQGDWADLLNDINNLADAILEPIAGTVEALDRMANGDLSTKMTGDFKGDHAKLKDAINTTLEELPFEEATEVLGTMADGDFTMRMQRVYKGDSEEFKQNINILAESMNSLINEINSAVNTTASSSVQLETTADTLATSIQELASQTDEVATAVEQMSSTITENADNINNTNDAAQSNMDIAVEGGKVVSETVEKMGQIGDVVSQSANNIEELGRSSKKIGEIINVIDEIADQTNLLALNAAIEAARAGEQGRGFAVVADEVRKLAERTGGATKEITDMVKEIQEQTFKAVDVMENGKIEVEKGITLAGTAGNSLEQIVSNAKSILERINFIADASREQSATSEEISKNVTAIAEVTQDSSNRVSDVSGLSGGLNQLTNDLSSLMSKFQTSENAVRNSGKLEGVESRYLGE
jgi:methyl-accepting chemotaxis protein